MGCPARLLCSSCRGLCQTEDRGAIQSQCLAGNWEALHHGNLLEPAIHSVTIPGTEQSGGAAKSARSSTAKGETQRAQPPSSAQRGDSPIVQEPEDPQLHQESLSPRRSSLVIVESTEEQVEKSGRGYEEESLEKVNEQFCLNTINQILCLAHSLR